METVTRPWRAHLGLVEDAEGRILYIRAWDFHAGLWDRGALMDYDFCSMSFPRALSENVPRVAFITAKRDEFGGYTRHGIRGSFPRRHDKANAVREKSLRPRVRLHIANPRSYDPERAHCPRRHEGMLW